MKYWKVIFIHIPLFSSIILQSTVYASIQQQQQQQQQSRKHSTAHYFQNGTVYILGGIEFDLNATQSQFASSSILTLRFDKKDFSLHSTAANPLSAINENLPISLPPTIGHTSHLHVPSNSIFSVFGMQQKNKESPPLIPSPSSTTASVIQQNRTLVSSPTSRYHHTSVLINNNSLYVIGGKHVSANNKTQQQFIGPQDLIWNYSFSTKSWKSLHTTTTSSMAGHTTFVYDKWLISCFGQQEQGLINSCTWFDTINFNSTKITPPGSSIKEWPTARTYASMISLANNNHVLFGGETEDGEILDDLWQLHVDSAFTMTWQKVKYDNVKNINYKRSGHASALLADEKVVLYYGGQNGLHSLATDPIYLDISKMEWIHTKTMNSDGRRITQNGVDLSNSDGSKTNNGLSGGAIGGIIVSIVGVIALGIGFFVWRRRHRQQNIHQKSRAARFSRAPSPMHNIPLHQEKMQQRNSNRLQGEQVRFSRTAAGGGTGLAGSNFLSLPELALSRESSNRISAISLGAEFRFSADDYRRHSHQSSDSAVLGGDRSSTIPKIELISSSNNQGERNSYNSSSNKVQLESLSEGEHDPTTINYKRRESTGFKRLTLNLFSGTSSSQQQDDPVTNKKKDRNSSLFQLRASRLLQPGTPSTPGTPNERFPLSTKGNGLQSRVSLGAKSVSSVQWVGFNDNMDYKGNNWRDSSASSMHLAVTNAHRSSSHTSLYYTSDSAQSTPRSPMFPNHLRDSTANYQLNEMEANSWKLELTKNSSSTLDSEK